jgi:hypothetical protein
MSSSKPTPIDPNSRSTEIVRLKVDVKSSEDFQQLLKTQMSISEDNEIVLINIPQVFPADCRVLTMSRKVYDAKYYQSVQDYDTFGATLEEAAREVIDFTAKTAREPTRVGYVLMELNSRDAAHADELKQVHLVDKPGHCWLMAVCTGGALKLK